MVRVLETKRTGVLTFGIAVTNRLYAALQVAQGLNPDLDGDGLYEGEGETASADEIEFNMPSLSRAQVANLMLGLIINWEQLKVGDVAKHDGQGVKPGNIEVSSEALTTYVFSQGYPDLIPAVGNDPTGKARVTICRLTPGSGIQAQFNALFLNSPCSAKGSAPKADNTICTRVNGAAEQFPACASATPYTNTMVTAGRAIVHEGEGAGQVRDCLDQLNVAGRWAIGLQSVERISSKWSFIKLNHASPRLANVSNGEYFDWALGSLNYSKTLSGNVKLIADAIAESYDNCIALNELNAGWIHGWGRSGWLSAPVKSGTPVRGFNDGCPVMQYGHTSLVSICSPVQSHSGSDIDLPFDNYRRNYKPARHIDVLYNNPSDATAP